MYTSKPGLLNIIWFLEYIKFDKSKYTIILKSPGLVLGVKINLFYIFLIFLHINLIIELLKIEKLLYLKNKKWYRLYRTKGGFWNINCYFKYSDVDKFKYTIKYWNPPLVMHVKVNLFFYFLK